MRTGRAVMLLAGLISGLSVSAPASARVQVTHRDGGIEVRDGKLLLRVDAVADDLLRVRIAADGRLAEDASWAVSQEMRAQHVAVRPLDDAGTPGFRTATLAVRIARDPLRLIIEDGQGRIVSADTVTAPVVMQGRAFTLRKAMPASERYFGLGDKTGPLDRRSGAFVNWNTDVGRFGEATDPLYKSIPFFVASGGDGGSYGIFLDNTWRSWFDFGRREQDVLAFGAVDGPIDYYLIHGPSLRRVVERYTDLTGKPPLAPLWSLGYQQSRYSYMSSQEVRGIAARLRRERIPTDVIWLDIDFQDRNRPFTTNPETFPDLLRLAADLREDGIRVVAITDLHIAHAPDQDYAPFDSGTAGDHFVKRPDGEPLVGKVWPGASVFPDFTRADTRAWWGSLYAGFVKAGVAGFWNDMNEPALFETPSKTMPLDTVHRIEGSGFAARQASHAEIHNVYGMENSRATFEGLQALVPDQRPFVMTRASYAGGQRYAATWTGDNSSTWSHLKLSVAQLLNLGLSGFAYSAVDIGGFTGGASPELMTRWFQIGAFLPVFRNHVATDAPRAEPWVDGVDHTAIRRRFIEQRYRLLPYLYALADENARTGAPLMRPVFYDYPQALSAPCDQSMAFLLGESLLIAPSPTPESPQRYRICLPGERWYDYWSGLEVAGERGHKTQAGFVTLHETPTLERLPVFVRGGTILPQQGLVQSTTQTPRGPLTLHVYPGDDCRGVLYADDGLSLGYRQGRYLRQAMRCSVSADGVTLSFAQREGDYAPWWRRIEVVVHGWRGDARVELGGKPVAATPDASRQTLRLEIDDQPAAARLSLRAAK